ncbi:MAG: hypothetical protein K8R28_00655, partial [Desulfobacterales bacterium]|nr:hypothetical protein [Desulfobacterales bacterium]
ATNCGFSLAMNTTALLRLAIARYYASSRLAFDAHCSPKKTQFATFRGIYFPLIQTAKTGTSPVVVCLF